MHVSARRGVPFDAAREMQQRPRYFSESSSASLVIRRRSLFPATVSRFADLLLAGPNAARRDFAKAAGAATPFSPRPAHSPFINHGVRPAPRCPATPSRTAPRARPVRPLNRSFARANARSRSTEPANPRAIDRATDLVPSYFPRADRDATAGVRRRNTGGGGGAQKTGQGNNMSMLRYYTDDSPVLKITPVRARTPSPNRQPSRGSGHFFTRRAPWRVVFSLFSESEFAPDRARLPVNPHPKQNRSSC